MISFNYFKIAAFLLFVAALGSCQKETQDFDLSKTYDGVETELWEHFENFEKAAAERGVRIDLAAAGITGSIGKIHTPGLVGICNHNADTPNHVMIDIDFWRNASQLAKEMIIFHELGHCFLHRGHNDDQHHNGTCKSIMRSGKGGCLDLYNNSNRGDYMDELFTETH